MLESLCLFDDATEVQTRYQPPIDRLTLIEGDLSDAPGLLYEAEFVTPGEERALLWNADNGAWSDYWSRRTQFYGFKYDRSARQIDLAGECEPVPRWTNVVRRRLVERGFMEREANQLGINEYLPGQGIAGHVDYFGGVVVSLTLLTGCVMDIVEPSTKRRVSLWLAPRSIVVLRNEVRNIWEHAIARRNRDIVNGHPIRRGRRVSITFRDVFAEAVGAVPSERPAG